MLFVVEASGTWEVPALVIVMQKGLLQCSVGKHGQSESRMLNISLFLHMVFCRIL